MKRLFTTPIGRLRLIGYLEGISLFFLLFVAMPMKHWGGNSSLAKMTGPIHGMIFLWFVISALGVGVEQQWKFKETTWKVILACFIPFGTFYINLQILRPIAGREELIVK